MVFILPFKQLLPAVTSSAHKLTHGWHMAGTHHWSCANSAHCNRFEHLFLYFGLSVNGV